MQKLTESSKKIAFETTGRKGGKNGKTERYI